MSIDTDYGPLKYLIGTWKGDKGLDLAPEPDGQEENPYYESIHFEGIGGVTNAEKQRLAVLRYHQVVKRKKNDEVFHDETGYWMWDANEQIIMQSFSIPRGVCVLAGTKYQPENDNASSIEFSVQAQLNDPHWAIIQSPFMKEHARTSAFSHQIKIQGKQLIYSETTSLDIYGRSFEHTDQNTLDFIS